MSRKKTYCESDSAEVEVVEQLPLAIRRHGKEVTLHLDHIVTSDVVLDKNLHEFKDGDVKRTDADDVDDSFWSMHYTNKKYSAIIALLCIIIIICILVRMHHVHHEGFHVKVA